MRSPKLPAPEADQSSFVRAETYYFLLSANRGVCEGVVFLGVGFMLILAMGQFQSFAQWVSTLG